MWVCRLPVHIGPAEQAVFMVICGKFVTASRADVGIGPYDQSGKCIRICRGFSMLPCFLPGGAEPRLRIH